MRLAVRYKLVLLSSAIIVGVSGGFLALNLWLANRWGEDEVQRRVVAFARVLAATITSRQEFENNALLIEQVRQIRAAREDLLQLDVIAFQPPATNVVATSNPAERLPFTRRDTTEVLKGHVVSRSSGRGSGRHWDVLAPITLDGSVAGAVAARFSSASVEGLVFQMRTWAFLVTGGSVLAMGLLMGLAVRSVVDRPVRGFLRAIDRIQAGDAAATVTVRTADEFGLLAEHFNAMMDRIRRFNDELTTRIGEATRELDRRYQEVRQLNAQLFEMQRTLLHAERLAVAGRIMGEVAHEVGTPLHSVAGHLELLRKDLPPEPLSGETQRRVAVIEAQVARVIEIIARLLDLTRRPTQAARAVDLNRIVRDIADLVRPGVSAAGLTLVVDTGSGVPPVAGSPDHLQQVILNLLTNAVDATPAGGRVSVGTRSLDGGEVELTVADTGRGIAPPDQERVFEPFFSTKPAGRGSGLGLFITAQIVRDHKGHIDLESDLGRGSTFRVVLPAVEQVS